LIRACTAELRPVSFARRMDKSALLLLCASVFASTASAAERPSPTFTNEDIARIQRERPETVTAPSKNAAPGQLFLCRGPDGQSSYWASNWCNTTGGHTVDIVRVPNGLPFAQQVKIAEQIRAKTQSTIRAEDSSRDRYRNCRAIDDELAQIWSPYDNGQFNTPAQIGRDQQRTRELKSHRASLACETR